MIIFVTRLTHVHVFVGVSRVLFDFNTPVTRGHVPTTLALRPKKIEDVVRTCRTW